MLNYSIMSLDEEHIDQFCADIEYQVKNKIATMPLFCMTITPEGIDLSYEETELTGMAGTTTTFSIRGQRVTLTRSGSVNSQMIFEEGKQHSSLYATLFGDMTIDIQTSRLRHNMTERGGVMDIRYSIAVEHVVTGRNVFRIRVREKT